MSAARAAKAGPDAAGAPTAEDDERLRGLIRTELDRQHARPVARRTLELLAEAAAEPTDDELGYRVVDRSGAVRLQRDLDPDENRGDVTAPMTLRDLVAELRERYPDLFAAPPEPEPEPIPPPPPEPGHDALAEVRAAGARFVETQSALAMSLAATSTERGRVLADAASERLGGWRTRIAARLKARAAPAPVAAELPEPPSAAPGAPAAGQAGGHVDGPATGRLGLSQGRVLQAGRAASGRLRDGGRAGTRHVAALARRGRDALSRFDPDAVDLTWLRRAAFAGLGAACLAAVVAAAVVVSRTGDGAAPAGTEAPRTESADARNAPRSEPQGEARATTAPVPEEARPGAGDAASEDPEARPAEEVPPAADPNALVGVPQVVDTATLRVAGRVVHLFGVEWVRGGQADELTKYLRGRSVACRPAPGSSAYLCRVNGRDLSEVVLFNGGGRASAEASPDLAAAEDHARSERLGVWKR